MKKSDYNPPFHLQSTAPQPLPQAKLEDKWINQRQGGGGDSLGSGIKGNVQNQY